MMKNCIIFTWFLLLMVSGITVLSCSQMEIPDLQTGIPLSINDWRIEIVPAGNEFYRPADPPSDELVHILQTFAPHATLAAWNLRAGEQDYQIRTDAEDERYEFIISVEGKISEIKYRNTSTNIREEPGKLILKDSKQHISVNDLPPRILEMFADSSPEQAWIASTPAGQRYVIVVEDTAFYARLDGQIQAAGLIRNGALNEIDPSLVSASPTLQQGQEDTLAEIQELLEPYRERFNIDRQLQRLQERFERSDRRLRFVAMGDSRSNQELWESMIQHIAQLDPPADFIINTGDIVYRGYAQEFREYYIPPLVDIAIPVFNTIGRHDLGMNKLALEFRYLFGDRSLNYFFDYAGSRFIFFDNDSNISSYEDNFTWLERILADTPDGVHKYVVTHRPPRNIEKWAWHAWDKDNSERFTTLMTNYHVDHVFLGHIHAYSTAILNDVHYTVTGGGGAPLYKRFGPSGNVHHYLICDILPDGTMQQQVVRFYKEE